MNKKWFLLLFYINNESRTQFTAAFKYLQTQLKSMVSTQTIFDHYIFWPSLSSVNYSLIYVCADLGIACFFHVTVLAKALIR